MSTRLAAHTNTDDRYEAAPAAKQSVSCGDLNVGDLVHLGHGRWARITEITENEDTRWLTLSSGSRIRPKRTTNVTRATEAATTPAKGAKPKADKPAAKKTREAQASSKAKQTDKAPVLRIDGQPRGRALDSEDGTTRTCSRCGTEKRLDTVHYYRRANGTYCSHCRECHKAADNAARERKAEKVPAAA